MSSRYIITLPNGQGLTAKQIELMSAVFQNASRDLLRTVSWHDVAAQTGHAQARIARDTFSRRCDVRGWLQGGITILGQNPPAAPPAAAAAAPGAQADQASQAAAAAAPIVAAPVAAVPAPSAPLAPPAAAARGGRGGRGGRGSRGGRGGQPTRRSARVSKNQKKN